MRTVFSAFTTAAAIAGLALSGLDRVYAEEQENLQFDPPVSPRKNIRFYKVNKQLQADKIMLTEKKAASPGCQNFLKSVRVYRVMQTGYSLCSLYAEKDCKAYSIVDVAREKDPSKTSLLTEGVGWMPQSDDPQGVKLASWNCGFKVEPEMLSYEAGLATREVTRLTTIAVTAEERAAIAQRKAAKARKLANDATEQAALAKRRAIAAGVAFPDDKVVIDAEATEGEQTPEIEAAKKTGK